MVNFNVMLKKLSGIKWFLVLIILVASFLRFYKLTVNPPSLFGDELDLGYHAYSILKTGHDYQGNFMPIHFHSIAEWRTPLYLYSAVPTVGIWGVTPLGVRVPAAVFGILGVLAMYLFVKKVTNNEIVALTSAGLLAISPWDLQYSRAGFEVTEMLFFLLTGLWLFITSLNKPKWLWLSVFFLVLTAWVYSTAKFFTPLLFIFLLVNFRKEIFSMGKVNLIKAGVIGLIIGLPIAYGTLFGGGTQRFGYISIFSDPTTEASVGSSRELAARVRGENGAGLSPSLIDRVVYNKFTYWGGGILKNYLGAFSTNFLFIKGDPNPRQSVGAGGFYRIEIIALILGIIFFFSDNKIDKKLKLLIGFLILSAPIPSALTTDGSNHATRLIFLLPPFIFLIAYGWVSLIKKFTGRVKMASLAIVAVLYFISVFFYLHEYYTVYSWNSERWWHYGWGPAITEIKSIDKDYDRVIISMSGEPAWIFFAGYYQFDPATWQKEFPIGRDVEILGFGKVSHIQKYYFGSPDKSVQIYGLSRYIDSKTLYLANANEVGGNLIRNPNETPAGLKLIKAIPFPSGEPVFYLFAGTK